MENYLILFCTLAFQAFAAKRLLTYLHIFQQEEYDNERFVSWLWAHKVFDKRVSGALFLLGVLSFYISETIILVGMTALFAWVAYFEKDPRHAAKKKLALTNRAIRIYFPALIVGSILGFSYLSPFLWILAVQALPFLLPLTNKALEPYERKTQKKFYDEAVQKLGTINPKIIAITGSYGKTSVKHILGHILKNGAPTLITPGSVNTVMGITRIIREQLNAQHQYFVVEMGAYGIGSIKTLCALTPPDYGIITAIGHAHYERFKTLENVAEAKYELAEAVIQKNGKIIVQEQTLRFAHTQGMRDKFPSHFVICPDAILASARQEKDGLHLEIIWEDKSYPLFAPLYGLHHAQNIAIAFLCALSIGMSPEDITAALVTTPQITHRLELKPQGDGSFIIDDAYNSNPQGFQSGLELLRTLRPEGGRAILVTPGMVELGAAHDAEHQKLGTMAAGICDIVIAINPARIESFVKAYHTAGGKELRTFETFMQAQEWIIANKKSGDYILLENDLPDLYERVPRI